MWLYDEALCCYPGQNSQHEVNEWVIEYQNTRILSNSSVNHKSISAWYRQREVILSICNYFNTKVSHVLSCHYLYLYEMGFFFSFFFVSVKHDESPLSPW